MKFDFAGKVVLITGGTSGIGLSAARMFLDAGASVAVVGRSLDRGAAAVRELASAGNGAFFMPGDVSSVAECERLIAECVKRFGRLDVLVNSAGIYMEETIGETTELAFDRIMAVNVKGTYFMARASVLELRRALGNIVNVSSDAGINGNFACSAYCASKGAVTVFTKALALEMAPQGVRVNCVCPGDVATPMLDRQLAAQPDPAEYRRQMASVYPLGRIGTAEEVAGVIVFLASDSASFVTGAAWTVDGGLTSA